MGSNLTLHSYQCHNSCNYTGSSGELQGFFQKKWKKSFYKFHKHFALFLVILHKVNFTA